MPEEFNFRQEKLCLKLCGNVFCIDLDENIISKCSEILKEARQKLEKVREDCGNSGISDESICKFFQRSIDSLLGAASVGKIFGERPLNLDDLSDLMCYIVTKIRVAIEGLEPLEI